MLFIIQATEVLKVAAVAEVVLRRAATVPHYVFGWGVGWLWVIVVVMVVLAGMTGEGHLV